MHRSWPITWFHDNVGFLIGAFTRAFYLLEQVESQTRVNGVCDPSDALREREIELMRSIIIYIYGPSQTFNDININ